MTEIELKYVREIFGSESTQETTYFYWNKELQAISEWRWYMEEKALYLIKEGIMKNALICFSILAEETYIKITRAEI